MSLRPKGYYLNGSDHLLHVGDDEWWYSAPKLLDYYLDKSGGWGGDPKETGVAVLIAPSNLMWWED